MAAFVVRFGWTPDQYWSLTLEEHAAIIDALRNQSRRG